MSVSENQSQTQAEPTRNAGIHVNVFGRTDVGLVREHNEDNFLVADLTLGNRSIKPEVRDHKVGEKGSLFVVCDGMGGAAAGEVASEIAVDTIYEVMQAAGPSEDDEELARRLELAIIEAGKRIFAAAKEDRRRRGMGTTVTAAAMIGPRLIIGQVGDSRAYILRKGKFIQVTKDQSLVQQLLDAKQLTEEEAKNFEKSNIILQALGTAQDIQVDMTSAVLRRGDELVMCSDGLSGIVESDAIASVVQRNSDPVDACKALTNLACDGGGHDNITVIVARFDGDDLLEPDDSEELAYRKFRYASSAETTVRSQNLLLVQPPPEEREEPTEGFKVPTRKELAEATRPSPREGKVSVGLFAAAGIALLVGIAFIAFTLSSRDAKEKDEEGISVPVNSIPAAPTASSQDSEVEKTEAPALEPVPEPEPEPEQVEAPVLSPTPEEMVVGTEEQAPPEKAERPEKTEQHQAESKKDTGKSEKASAPEKPINTTKPKKKEKQDKKAQKDDVLAPKPIDDNPF